MMNIQCQSLRTNDAKCLFDATDRGFTMNIGSCTTDEAEAWTLLKGLQVAYDKGIRKIEIRSDSRFITNMLNRDSRSYNLFNLASNILDKCRNIMLQRFEEKRVLHVFREQTRAADVMAKLCYTYGRNLRVFRSSLSSNPAYAN